MSRNRRNSNDESQWEVPAELYDFIFGQADNMLHICHENVVQRGTFDYGQNSDRDQCPARSRVRCRKSQVELDEALARQLQLEMEDDFGDICIGCKTAISAGGSGFSRGETSVSERNRNRDEVHPADHQDDIDPDNMTYEQIQELGESIGNVKSKGLSEDQLSMLPSHKYKPPSTKKKGSDNDAECAICKARYRKGDMLMTLPCLHKYHADCIKTWLAEDNSCCICKQEVNV